MSEHSSDDWTESAPVPDPNKAHSGRVHNYLLGGKDHYLSDIKVGENLVEKAGEFTMVAREARRFLVRGVRYAVGEGVDQIIELGSGYPCDPNLHEVAQAVNPNVRTLYVDNDPIVAAHGRALLADEQTQVLSADFTDTSTIVAAMETSLNSVAPIVACFGFVLEFVDDATKVVQTLVKSLPPRSAVVLSHITADVDGAIARRAAKIYAKHKISFSPRTREEITDLLTGCDLAEPGLVSPQHWRPDDLEQQKAERPKNSPRTPAEMCCYAAVGWIR